MWSREELFDLREHAAEGSFRFSFISSQGWFEPRRLWALSAAQLFLALTLSWFVHSLLLCLRGLVRPFSTGILWPEKWDHMLLSKTCMNIFNAINSWDCFITYIMVGSSFGLNKSWSRWRVLWWFFLSSFRKIWIKIICGTLGTIILCFVTGLIFLFDVPVLSWTLLILFVWNTLTWNVTIYVFTNWRKKYEETV